MYWRCCFGTLALVCAILDTASAQPYGAADRGEPGDAMIQAYLGDRTQRLNARFADDLQSLEDWQARRQRYREEYFYMLGLWPLPERTPLHATVTGTLEGDGYVVEMLHYQSRPGLYVTGNLYRPPQIAEDERLPAVFYVCGHSGRGRNGNKTAFQSHGIWFARHGYVCLIVDTLQLGEIAATHHGTYNHDRWWWLSRGYTSAGVECWNGVRGIDYLVSRGDVDPERIGVTGISGGGAATFWIAAADQRVRVAVPVSGMADLPSYVPNRVINGHCDCMFLHNTFQWPWTRIAALVAPRPMLFVNSDNDRIFPMDANDRVINRLERLYSLYGASDQVDAVVSIGGHAYRADIRKAVYRFLNTHLKNDPAEILDSEIDLVSGPRNDPQHPIPPEKLRVFPEDLPGDELNTTIDQHLVPLAEVPLPEVGKLASWREGLLAELRRVTFHGFPQRVPAARIIREQDDVLVLETEPGIQVRLRLPQQPAANDPVLVIAEPAADPKSNRPGSGEYVLEPRGVADTRWTTRNPPNYVERAHVLLGRTVDTGRVWDIAAAGRFLQSRAGSGRVMVRAKGRAAVLAAYAALLEPEIARLQLTGVPDSLMAAEAPPLMNALRVCDIPDVLGMLAPRELTLSASDSLTKRVRAIYDAGGASERLD